MSAGTGCDIFGQPRALPVLNGGGDQIMKTVGYRSDAVRGVDGTEFPLTFLYPSEAQESLIALGPYQVAAARDGEPAGNDYPLVAISHGSGGTPWVHRDLARHLVLNGFVVVMPEHIGNSRSDNSLVGTDEVLLRRPAQLSAAIDAAIADPVLNSLLRLGPIGIVGTSIGAYTALSLAGGQPWSGGRDSPRRLTVAHREDIGALVLLSPAVFWFVPEHSLNQVRVPMLVRNGEMDTITTPAHVALIRERVPPDVVVSQKVVENAGHFSFMSPFPASLVRPGFAPAHDPEGFDRVAYQATLHRDVAAFLAENLA